MLPGRTEGYSYCTHAPAVQVGGKFFHSTIDSCLSAAALQSIGSWYCANDHRHLQLPRLVRWWVGHNALSLGMEWRVAIRLFGIVIHSDRALSTDLISSGMSAELMWFGL